MEGGCREPSKITVTYSLAAGSGALEAYIEADWQEQGGETVPVLSWRTPLQDPSGTFRYITPCGTITRGPLNNDVPGIGSGAALCEGGTAVVLASDSKYGYRGYEGGLSLTLINSATAPDPYPERGIHHIRVWLGVADATATAQAALTDSLNHAFFYQPGNVHEGSLPTTDGLVTLKKGDVAVTAVQPVEGGLIVRGYETEGRDEAVTLSCGRAVASACLTDLSETGLCDPAAVDGDSVSFTAKANRIWMVKILLK